VSGIINPAGDMAETIIIKALKVTDREAVVTLFKDAGWWDESYGNGDFIPRIIRRSTVYLGAFAGERLIGMGRAISDGVSDAYIQDVVVLKEMRGHGIGRRIVEEIVRRLRRRGIDWIGLVSTPGSEGFYESMGFEVMDRHSPMLLARRD
jgi:spermidine synthase